MLPLPVMRQANDDWAHTLTIIVCLVKDDRFPGAIGDPFTQGDVECRQNDGKFKNGFLL